MESELASHHERRTLQHAVKQFMSKDELTRLFHEASTACVSFARTFVTDHLPDATVYEVFPNSSYDGHPLHKDERAFPDDELPRDEFLPMNAEQVIDFLEPIKVD